MTSTAPGRSKRLHAGVAALGEEKRCQREAGDSDGDVDEEDPLPAQSVREDAAEQHAGRGTEAADGAPDAKGDVALTPLGEGDGEDRERGRRDDRRAEPLERAGSDQRRLRPRQPREEGGEREDDDADEEDASASEQVGGAPAQEQEAAEDERVRADHPLEVFLREPEVDLNRGQRDVHDRDVQDDHELDDAQERQSQPFALSGNHHVVRFPFGSNREDCQVSRDNLQIASKDCVTASRPATLSA